MTGRYFYPRSLDDLATADPAGLVDPLTGKPWAYTSTGAGFTLRTESPDSGLQASEPLQSTGTNPDPVLEWSIERPAAVD